MKTIEKVIRKAFLKASAYKERRIDKVKRGFYALVMTTALLTANLQGAQTVSAGQYTPCVVGDLRLYQQIEKEPDSVRFILSVLGDANTEEVAGKVTIYDDTTKKVVDKLNVNYKGKVYTMRKTYSIDSKHTYTLIFNGYVENGKGIRETIVKSYSK